MVAENSRASYFRERRKSIGQFNVSVPKEKLSKLEEKLTEQGKTKTQWLTEKIDEEIGKDALLFFDNISTNNLLGKYNKLVTSPCGIENLIIEKLDELTAYQNASAILKCNSLTSKTLKLFITDFDITIFYVVLLIV